MYNTRISEISNHPGFNAVLRMPKLAKPVRALALSAGSALALGLTGCGVSPPIGWISKDLKMPSGGFFSDLSYMVSHVPPFDYQIAKCAVVSLIIAKVVTTESDPKIAWLPGLLASLASIPFILVDSYFFHKAAEWTPNSMMGNLNIAFLASAAITPLAGIGLGYLYNAFKKQ